MTDRGAINGWQCTKCQATTYAVHVDDGVTPMFLACRATDGCEGQAISMMYRVEREAAERVAWEWHRPSRTQLRRFKREDPAMYDHVRKGGLLLRELTDAGREALAPGDESATVEDLP